MVSRREFATRLGAGLLAPAVLPPARASLHAPDASHAMMSWPGYERAFVLDMLATAGPFNVPNWLGAPLSPAMVANARQSGITAVNSTVSALGPTVAESFEGTVRNLAAWHHEFDRHPDTFLPVRQLGHIRQAKAEKKLGVIFGFQDTTSYGDQLERVEMFHRLGVRIVQLTYNGSNLVGDGCLVPTDGGLKPFGREVVARLNTHGSLIDLSHCGWETTRQTIAASRVPVSCTHSGAAAVNNVPRNKPDDVLRQLADKGGVIGVFLMPFLRASGQPTAEDFLRHLAHCLNVCGEDHVGIGSDLSITPLDLTPEFRRVHADFVKQRRAARISAPGEDENVFNYVPEFNSPRRMELVADAMARAGHSSARIEKVLGGNWMRLLGDVWR
jgi:membrane dipeptidase